MRSPEPGTQRQCASQLSRERRHAAWAAHLRRDALRRGSAELRSFTGDKHSGRGAPRGGHSSAFALREEKVRVRGPAVRYCVCVAQVVVKRVKPTALFILSLSLSSSRPLPRTDRRARCETPPPAGCISVQVSVTVCVSQLCSHRGAERATRRAPGGTVVATKVGYFGVKSTNVHRVRDGAQYLLKSVACSRLASTLLKYVGSAQRRPPLPPPPQV